MPLPKIPAAFKRLQDLIKGGVATRAAEGASSAAAAALGWPIGVDFGTSTLKVLHLQRGDQPILLAAGMVNTPDELYSDSKKRLAFQVKALPELLHKMGAKTKRIACAIPAWATVCKHLQLNKADANGIAEQVAMMAPMQLQCDPESISYKFIEITPTGAPKPEVIVMAVSRELIRTLMQSLRENKLEPVGMHSEFTAELACFDCLHRREGDENLNTIYLDMGHSTTCVCISHGKQLAFARVVDIGGASINESLAEQLGCSVKEAQERRWKEMSTLTSRPTRMSAGNELRSLSTPPPPTNADIDRRAGATPAGLSEFLHLLPEVEISGGKSGLREALETLTDEVRMCLRFHATQFPQRKVSRVVFTGGEAMHHGVCQQIAQTLKLPGHVADPFTRLTRNEATKLIHVDAGRAQPGWVVALGACVSPTDL
jgi:type IV pilus assembly protein PilM